MKKLIWALLVLIGAIAIVSIVLVAVGYNSVAAILSMVMLLLLIGLIIITHFDKGEK